MRFWRARADYFDHLGRLHRARGERLRATDGHNRARALAVRLDDPQRHAEAVGQLLQMALDDGDAAGVADYARALLRGPRAAEADLRPVYADIQRIVAALPAAARPPIIADARALAATQGPEADAILRLSLARWHRADGRPEQGPRLLAEPLAWARRAGDIAAEVALRSEIAAAWMQLGRHAAALEAYTVNLERLEAWPDCPPAALERARDNWRVALVAGSE